MNKKRCDWAVRNEHETHYHDTEWGIPVLDDSTLFEFLILEGQQAGLSWDTILRKRETLREAYLNFDYYKLSQLKDENLISYRTDDRVIKHRLKIESVRTNAQAFIKIIDEFGSFSKYIWAYVNNVPIINGYKSINDIPSKTDLSDTISKDLKKRGFKFIGSTIMYSFMQACGLVNDHIETCFLYHK